MKYLVSHQGQQLGPYGLDEIVRMVRARELELFDYIYDLEKDDWVLLMEMPVLAARLKSSKPGKPPQVGIGTTKVQTPVVVAEAPVVEIEIEDDATEPLIDLAAHAITEWFILKGENRFGPFSYTDLVKMLQQKVVFPFDFVWHSGMKSWQRVAELADFHVETIRRLFDEGGRQGKDVFVQRRFKRATFAGRVIIHDGMTLWRGEGLEISKGGVGVTMQNSLVVPGQQLTVHFNRSENWPAFNAVCEVVSKKFVNDKSPVEYGLRFLSLSQEAQDELHKRVV